MTRANKFDPKKIALEDLEDLAKAVYDFADWQQVGYTTDQAESKHRKIIGRALWLEVSDRVREVLGKEPPSPSFGE